MTAPLRALIVSGWLGAGKTTLVSHLLREAQRQGIKLAIISNEFGQTGIDRALLDAGQDGLVELDGGCVCCKLSDALGETITQIVARARPDRLVLECSGVALPGDLLVQFWRPPLSDLIAEATVVTVVDAATLDSALASDRTFLHQVEAADLLVLNKVDRVTPAARAAGEALLAELSSGRPVLAAVRGEVASDLLFGEAHPTPDFVAAPEPHAHAQFTTTEWRLDGEITEAELVARILAADPVRAKGFFRSPDGVRLVQGVGRHVEVTEPPFPPPPELVGTVVLIALVPGDPP